jgi:cell cycle checkpoint control protein RAD9A
MHHVVINVKDFKTIVAHADGLGCSISAWYSCPNRPMRVSYSNGSITCEFTLMTTGGLQGTTAAKAPPVSHRPLVGQAGRAGDRQPLMAARSEAANATSQNRRPQSDGHISASQREQRSSPPPPETSLDDQSLFFPEGTADVRWNARNEINETEDRVYWDASAESTRLCLARDEEGITPQRPPPQNEEDAADEGIAPTQRISEVSILALE